MGMDFNSKKKRLYIDWDEKKKEGIDHYSGNWRVEKIFFHPKHHTKIYRVTLKGKLSNTRWVERFAADNKYTVASDHDDNGKEGFTLVNWNAWESGEKPISSPNLDGAIHQFTKMIPDELNLVKQKVIASKDIIKDNLIKNSSFFEDLGIYYKSEEIEREKGTLLIDNEIFIDKDEMSDEEYAKALEVDGRLEKVVWELTTPVPEPIEIEVEAQKESDEISDWFDEEELLFDEDDFIDDLFYEEENSEETHTQVDDEFDELMIEEGELDFDDANLLLEEKEEIPVNTDEDNINKEERNEDKEKQKLPIFEQKEEKINKPQKSKRKHKQKDTKPTTIPLF